MNITEKMTDIQMLHDYEMSASAAVAGYSLFATEAHDDSVRHVFAQMAAASLNSQKKVAEMLKKYGRQP